MEISMNSIPSGARYKLLASLVVPRPIAWVTTMDGRGRVNAAPYSFFNLFGSDPAMLALAPGNRRHAAQGEQAVMKDTARNIRETREFVVHMVTDDLMEEMLATSLPVDAGVDELEMAGLETAPAVAVRVPRIAAAAAAFECREIQTIEIGGNRLVVGEVLHVHARDGLVEEGSLYVDPKAWSPVGRMSSPDWYCRTTDVFRASPASK